MSFFSTVKLNEHMVTMATKQNNFNYIMIEKSIHFFLYTHIFSLNEFYLEKKHKKFSATKQLFYLLNCIIIKYKSIQMTPSSNNDDKCNSNFKYCKLSRILFTIICLIDLRFKNNI